MVVLMLSRESQINKKVFYSLSKKFLGIESFETSVADKKLVIIGQEGLDEVVLEKLTKWVTYNETLNKIY